MGQVIIPPNCQDCRLSEHRTNVVQGEGPVTGNPIMLIGEAPGAEEDKEGKPFCNKWGAGRILNSLLYNAGIRRSDIYVTNPVACRPPNNRQPEKDELEACSKYLQAQIDYIKPRLIITMGAISRVWLTGLSGSHRGLIRATAERWGSYPTLITLHPSALIREQREMYPVVVHDLSKVHDLDFYTKEYPEDYHYDPPRAYIEEFFKTYHGLEFGMDIETRGSEVIRVGRIDTEKEGLNPFKGEIEGIAIGAVPGHIIQLSGTYLKENWDFLLHHLAQETIVGHNGIFDRTFILVHTNTLLKASWDTMTGMYITHSSLPKKLDFLRSLYTNFDSYKSDANYASRLGWLNCKDVDTTLISRNAQRRDGVPPEQMKRLLRSEDIAIKMRAKGVLLDQNLLGSHYAQIYPTIGKLQQEFMYKYNADINSPKQLSYLLYNQLELSYPTKAIKKTLISTDDETLQWIVDSTIGYEDKIKVVKEIQEYRELNNIKSKYCEAVYKLLDDNSVVHPAWRPTGTDTRRWSCSDPNLMGVPKNLRDMYVARPGHIFMAADYSSMQIWGAAILSKCQSLIDILSDPTRKIHREVQHKIDEVYPLTKTVGDDAAYLRAKAVVFGTLFGRTPEDIAREFRVDVSVAELWQQGLLHGFPELASFFETAVKEWKATGYVEGVYGARKYCSKATEAKNGKVQNFEAEVVTNAMHRLEEEGFTQIITVHDQLVMEEPEAHAEERFKVFLDIMSTSSPDLYHYFPVAGKMGYDWKTISKD